MCVDYLIMAGIEELELPRALLARIVKAALPDGTLLQKDAKNAMSKASTIFVSYLTAAAIDVATSAKHKSLASDDVFQALHILDFDRFVPMIKDQLSTRKLASHSSATSMTQLSPTGHSISNHSSHPM